MRWWTPVWLLVGVVLGAAGQWFGGQTLSKGDTSAVERCFCQLKGAIDDCSCSVETIDSFNNLRIFPRLNSLLHQNFFRYWKVNLNKKCPFWEDDGKCAIRYCSVQPCTDQEESIKATKNKESQASKSARLNLNFIEDTESCSKVNVDESVETFSFE